jgi:hypothetical protein
MESEIQGGEGGTKSVQERRFKPSREQGRSHRVTGQLYIES